MYRFFSLALVLALTLLPAVGQAASRDVTRGDFVTALWESAGAVPYDARTPFSDLSPDDACATAVGWAFGHGLVQGTGEGLFSPHRPITREEAAVLLRRWSSLLGRDTFLPDGVAECNDYMDISPWADDSLYWACDVGLILWSSGGRLNPGGTMNPEEFADLMARFVSGSY